MLIFFEIFMKSYRDTFAVSNLNLINEKNEDSVKNDFIIIIDGGI